MSKDDGARAPVRRRPEHGLLALQRAVGNKAVGAIIQRTLIKDAQFESEDEKKDAEKAVEDHRAHHALVTTIVNEAARADGTDELTVRLANSAKLIKNKVIKLYVLSAPHDQLHPGRVRHGVRPWIQSPVPGDANSYHKEHSILENLEYMDGTGIFGVTNALKEIRILFKPGYARTREDIEATLRHEVQHVVDFHEQVYGKQKNLVGDNDWITYATEYRAHYLQEARPSGDRQSVTKAVADGQSAKHWVSQQQFDIFKQIYDNYKVVKERWDKEERKLSTRTPKFQQAVLGLVEPTSINPLNSPTLHGLYDMILDFSAPVPAVEVAVQFGRLTDSDVERLKEAVKTFPVVNRALERVAESRLARTAMEKRGVTYTPTSQGQTGN